jgi:class 3 adenylate cyclase
VTPSADDPCPLPEDPALAEVAESFRDSGHWIDIVDPNWHVVYSSDDLRLAQGFMVERAPALLGLHMFGPESMKVRDNAFVVNTTGWSEVLAGLGGWVLADTVGGRAALQEIVDPSFRDVVDQLSATSNSAASSSIYHGTGVGGARPKLVLTAVRIHDKSGRLAGTLIVQKPHLNMSMLATLAAQGDVQHFERMQSVSAAERRPAAVLFADLEGSTALGKKLSTAKYFALGRRLTRAADQCVVEAGGITGRHAGDGVVAFFVADTFDSESAAARACIQAARSLRTAMVEVAERSGLEPEDLTMRFGLHWGSTLYMGLISTVGRTEVTALGDEVNEGARIEACATGGRALASKMLVERLTENDAEAIDIDLDDITYVQLGDLDSATTKARRDAPSIAVCEI